MTPVESELARSLHRYAESVPVPADGWAENQRRLARSRTSRTRYRGPLLAAAAVVAVAATTAGVIGARPGAREAPSAAAAPSVDAVSAVLIPAARRLPVGVVAGPEVVVGTGVIDPPRYDPAGVQLAVADYSGQVVVVTTWASWCTPCQSQLTDLDAAASALASSDVRFLGVDVRDDYRLAQVYLQQAGIAFPSLALTGAELGIPGVAASSIPATVLIDREQQVAAVFNGVVDADVIVDAAFALAAE